MKDNRLNLYFNFSEAAGVFTAVMGLFVLAGWIFNVPLIKSVLPGLVTMKANTAVCFTLIGTALWFLQLKRIDKQPFRILGKLFASIAALIGLLTLYEYLSGNSLGIDQLLFTEPAGVVFTTYAGRMALITAVNFFLVSMALLSLDIRTRRGYYPSQFLAVIAGFITLSALYGYVYGISAFSGRVSIYTAMALHTTAAFILMCLGALFARPDKGLSGVITSSLSGGTMMRRLLLVIIMIPTLSGWLKLIGEKEGLYNSQFGTALMVSISVALLIAVIWWTAAVINSAERKRETIQAGLNAANEEWRTTFDSMPDPVLIIDMDNTIRNVNKAAASILAKSPEEIIGRKCYEIMHGLNAPLANCPMEKTKRDHKPCIEEVNDPHIGIPLLVTTSPIFDKNHRMTGVAHVAKDISSIKKTENALTKKLRDFEIFYKAAVDREIRIKELKKLVQELESKVRG